MHTLKRHAIVPYSAAQMFALVNNVADYPRFLPWCKTSTVTTQTETEVVASLDIAWKGIHQSFTTRNELYLPDRIEIRLVNGPLRYMEGVWLFQALDEMACKVSLDMEFAFAGSFIDKFFQPIFQHIADSMVEAFCNRATEVYGHERVN